MKRAVFISLPVLVACAAPPTAEDLVPDYLGVETVALVDDLVQVNVAMSKVLSAKDLQDYAECGLSEYASARDYGYARHLRTNVYKEGGAFAADAVYTLSSSVPDGLAIIDTAAVLAECRAKRIPTV
jgi:hypothetical protein